MPRKKMRKIWNWRNERCRKNAGCLNSAASLTFRAKRNKCKNKHTIISEGFGNLDGHRRGGQWKGQVKISDNFDVLSGHPLWSDGVFTAELESTHRIN